ncbi:MAG: hypothetical protein N2Z21_10190, partial [Candidatus Sumerlaeaceae bacterium]|nr:hypothetical protein [Candidatus Sumerlaeaceae bacterium]
MTRDMSSESTALTSQIVRRFAGTNTFERFLRALRTTAPGEPVVVSGLRASAVSVFGVAAVQHFHEGAPCLLLVTSNAERASDLYEDLCFFGGIDAYHFPKSELLPYEQDEPSLEEQLKHLEVLHALTISPSRSQPFVCATSIEALLTRVPSLDVLRENLIELQWGQAVDTLGLARRLVELGYERVPTVERRGEFSIRGGIVDVFPLDTEHGVRLDLFGAEIESIRWFDVHTQRSLRREAEIGSITILPARLQALFHVAFQRQAETGQRCLQSLAELLPKNSLVLLDTPETYPLLAEHFAQVVNRRYLERLAADSSIPAPEQLYCRLPEVLEALQSHRVVHHSVVEESLAVADFDSHSFDSVTPSLEYYLTQFRKQVAQGRFV